MHEAHRYLGQAGPASDFARRLADALQGRREAAEARHYRRRAELVAAGEPPNRVVALVDGRRFELDEVAAVRAERVRFVFERNRVTLRPAAVSTGGGEALGAGGRHGEALDSFRHAAGADALDPHCRYLAAFALAHLRRYAEAERAYAEVERLAPGWFHCRAGRRLAAQLASGAADRETFLALHALRDEAAPAADDLARADEALGRAPRLAALHLLRGQALARLGRGAEATAALREGLACDPEPDVRSRLLVELGAAAEDPRERERCWREAQARGGNLVAAATARLALGRRPGGDATR